MSDKSMSRRKPRFRPPTGRPTISEYCPMCGEVGRVHQIEPMHCIRPKKTYWWACEQCIVDHDLTVAVYAPRGGAP